MADGKEAWKPAPPAPAADRTGGHAGHHPAGHALSQAREVRADQYGSGTLLKVDGVDIKFEIVLDGRIDLEAPGPHDRQCSVAALTPLDMVTGKLPADSDRWRDEAVMSLDLIDLTIMAPPEVLMTQAMAKARGAYGDSVASDLAGAVANLRAQPHRLDQCMRALFNDGVGLDVFSLLLAMLASGSARTLDAGLGLLLLREAGGGLRFGLVPGTITFGLLRSVDNCQVEALPTLAAVTGGAVRWPADGTYKIDLFWALTDELPNAVRFVLIGMEILLVILSVSIFLAAMVAMAVTLAARALTVGLPASLMKRAFKLPIGSGWVLTSGGLRGGIPVALALSLPAGPERDTVLALTNCIVVLSILGQGLSVGRVVRKAVTARC